MTIKDYIYNKNSSNIINAMRIVCVIAIITIFVTIATFGSITIFGDPSNSGNLLFAFLCAFFIMGAVSLSVVVLAGGAAMDLIGYDK